MNRKLQAELSNYLEITFQSDCEYDLTGYFFYVRENVLHVVWIMIILLTLWFVYLHSGR